MKIFTKKNILQFVSYFFVGGIAAIVEWIIFFVLSGLLGIQYIIATVAAFVFSTSINLILGKLFTFKNSSRYKSRKIKEALLIFAVSTIGLILNILLMYLFVNILGMNTKILMTISKVLSTGLVFVWNFLIRKFVIYKV